jgi:hypothetical protein
MDHDDGRFDLIPVLTTRSAPLLKPHGTLPAQRFQIQLSRMDVDHRDSKRETGIQRTDRQSYRIFFRFILQWNGNSRGFRFIGLGIGWLRPDAPIPV